MIKISIIIPVYNMQEYLNKCIESILAQTLKEIEIIFVDDGSTDNSFEILKQYQNNNSNIVIISQTNRGAGSARNQGIKIAKGDYIAFMDSDDFYSENDVLEILYTTAIREKVYICGGSLYREKEGKIQHSINELRKGLCFDKNEKISFKDYQFPYGFTRFIYKKSFLIDNSIYFPTYRYFEDPPFMVKAMVAANEFYAINKVVYVAHCVDKVVPFTRNSVLNGFINGIHDIIKLSEQEKLEKLYVDVLFELKRKMNWIYKSIYLGNTYVEEKVNEILLSLDEFLIMKDGRLNCKVEVLSYEEIFRLMQKVEVKEDKLWNMIQQYSKVVIYGAGEAGKRLYLYLKRKEYMGDIDFAVSSLYPKGFACGKRIRNIQEYYIEEQGVLVLIATINEAKWEMEKKAEEIGFKNIVVIDYNDLQLL